MLAQEQDEKRVESNDLDNVHDLDSQREMRPRITLSRDVFTKSLRQDDEDDKKINCSLLRRKARAIASKCDCKVQSCCANFVSLFPVLTWLPSYQWKSDFLSDFLAGLTVGIMSIPQGMAYARLAGMPPVYGLYTNIIPTFVYFLLGTAKHAAIGPATVLSLILGNIRYNHIPCEDCWMTPPNSTNSTLDHETLTPIELGSAVACLVGLFLIVMGLFRLSFISDYLPDQLVSGFTVACAVQVMAGQLSSASGITLPNRSEIGKVIMNFIDLFSLIGQTNVATFLIFLICFIFLMIAKRFINPRFQPKLKIPFPGEFIVMVVATLASYFGNFNKKFGVSIVKHIDSGFPSPELPDVSIMHTLLVESFVLAIVTYSYSISLAKLYAKRNGYRIQSTQEFYAYGGMNFIGSFFQCFNSGQSVSRSMVYELAGAKSQLCGMIGSMVVIFTVLFITPFMESLPNAALAAIIFAAAVEMFRNLKDLPMLLQHSRHDFAIYLISLVSVIILDVTLGLLVSVVFALLTVILRTQRSKVEKTDFQSFFLYSSHDSHDDKRNSEMVPQIEFWRKIKVLHLTSPLFYANAEKIKISILEECSAYARPEPSKLIRLMRKNEFAVSLTSDGDTKVPMRSQISIAILDVTSVPFIDLMGLHALQEVKERLQTKNISLYLGGCTAYVEKFLKINKFNVLFDEPYLFPSVLDAISYASFRIENERRISKEAQGTIDV